ncbi:uncharacterized protein LOC113235148 [Hyposmocoma kahamanoa]|uniref:uncharacterized protein LOC113235148 n=1 Tax=Hyposmocoma kahamanoa TaxID=1477025 RepID=UPI000E6D813B|nr:uncharacterized protein LOC113235148 [Hyposmocoma kahamanoa]
MARMENKYCVGFVLLLCLMWQVQAEVNCTRTGAGRFTDGTDATCKNYTLCIFNSVTNTYISYNYTCPTSSLFNPATAQCSNDYICNATNNTTSSSVCTEEGFVADPTSTNCTGYMLCVNVDGVLQEIPDTCPDSSFYDPETTLCVNDYNCTIPDFTCTAEGRFANTTDTTCKTYYMCVLLSTNNTYVEYRYTCPSTSVFNPTAKICTTSYNCPTA